MTTHDDASELYCPGCSYSLRGIDSARCPECGVELDWAKLAESGIPWVHRREVGRVRGFLKTVWMVIRSPGEIGREAVRDVGYRDAQRFRWIVVILATIPLWGYVLAGQLIWGQSPPGTPSVQPNWLLTSRLEGWTDFYICFYAGATLLPVPWLAVLLFFAGGTGVGSYLFHPGSIPIARQDRAVALSCYTVAPLALLVIPAVSFGVLIILHQMGALDETRPLTLGAFCLLMLAWGSSALLLVLFYIAPLRILFVATDASLWRVAVAALLLPVLWMVMGVLTLILLPMMAGFLRIVFLSYWL